MNSGTYGLLGGIVSRSKSEGIPGTLVGDSELLSSPGEDASVDDVVTVFEARHVVADMLSIECMRLGAYTNLNELLRSYTLRQWHRSTGAIQNVNCGRHVLSYVGYRYSSLPNRRQLTTIYTLFLIIIVACVPHTFRLEGTLCFLCVCTEPT